MSKAQRQHKKPEKKRQGEQAELLHTEMSYSSTGLLYILSVAFERPKKNLNSLYQSQSD